MLKDNNKDSKGIKNYWSKRFFKKRKELIKEDLEKLNIVYWYRRWKYRNRKKTVDYAIDSFLEECY